MSLDDHGAITARHATRSAFKFKIEDFREGRVNLILVKDFRLIAGGQLDQGTCVGGVSPVALNLPVTH